MNNHSELPFIYQKADFNKKPAQVWQMIRAIPLLFADNRTEPDFQMLFQPEIVIYEQ
ncbi:MAG: hypothetical protein IT269_08335 [Saprospiraceae bacterium]|nr:hypothetical protein [Saprospiraceae bacterium]